MANEEKYYWLKKSFCEMELINSKELEKMNKFNYVVHWK